jgi:endo-beta-N-acetylglucosaminidase D
VYDYNVTENRTSTKEKVDAGLHKGNQISNVRLFIDVSQNIRAEIIP